MATGKQFVAFQCTSKLVQTKVMARFQQEKAAKLMYERKKFLVFA